MVNIFPGQGAFGFRTVKPVLEPLLADQVEFAGFIRVGAAARQRDQTACMVRLQAIGAMLDSVGVFGPVQRVQIDQDQVDKVKASMESAAERRVQAAMGDVWKRLAETVSYFLERMDKPDAVFRDSTINNIAELVELIPGLNVLDDPAIEQVRAMVESKLTGIDAKDIRKDSALRGQLAGEAKAIMAVMSGYVRAFGGGQ